MLRPDTKNFRKHVIADTLTLWAGTCVCVLLGNTAVVWAAGPAGRGPSFFDLLLFPRFWVSMLAGLAGALLLKTLKVSRLLRACALAMVFCVFAVLPLFSQVTFFAGLSPHPSPMCALTKPVIFSTLNQQFIFPPVFAAVLALIACLSIIGSKLFCGWACPIGALQELAHQVPLRGKVKLPFVWANSIRAAALLAFVPALLVFGISLYGFFNPFEMLHWPLGTDFGVLYVWGVLAVTLAASLFMFRPFCHFLCPIGLLTWLAEHVALMKVRLRKDRCNNCRACVAAAPCAAVPAILAEKHLRPDCHACGTCIAACPRDALKFAVK